MNPLKSKTVITLLVAGHALVAVVLFCALPPEEWAWTSREAASSLDSDVRMFVYNLVWRLLAGVLAAQAGLLALWTVLSRTTLLVKLPASFAPICTTG